MLDDFCRKLTRLKLDAAQGGPKPYKPLLVLSVVVLIARGRISSPHIVLDEDLKEVFHGLLARLFPGQYPRADARYPFRHLATDGVWELVPADGAVDELAAQLAAGARARRLMAVVGGARLEQPVFDALVASPAARARVIETVCRAYRKLLPPNTALEVVALIAEAGAG